MTCGGIMLALAMESVLAQEDLDAEVSTGPTVNRFHSRRPGTPYTVIRRGVCAAVVVCAVAATSLVAAARPSPLRTGPSPGTRTTTPR
jgi:hypothetical protein